MNTIQKIDKIKEMSKELNHGYLLLNRLADDLDRKRDVDLNFYIEKANEISFIEKSFNAIEIEEKGLLCGLL